MYGVTLIVILAVMGGVIAYIGDKLGTRIGKKKLSIFGLRPKHTSILVTIITGIMIAAATLGMMTLASQDVRTALFGMEALKGQLASLSQEVTAQNVELADSRTVLESQNRELSALTAKVGEAARELTTVTRELGEAVAERDKTQAALNAMQADYERAHRDASRFRAEVAALQAAKQELDSRVGELNAARQSLQGDVDRLNEQTAALRQGIQAVREGVVVFRAGEMLGAAVVEGNRAVELVLADLSNVMYQMNRNLLDKFNIKDKNLEVLWISQEEFRQAAAKVAASPENMVVRIATAGNTVYGEPIIGVIELYPNRLVFPKDSTIYTETANVGADGQQAEAQIMMLLQKVNDVAIRQGILPDPLQGSVGTMSGIQLFEIVNRLKLAGGRVELTVVANSDTYTVGPLQIDIRIRKLF